MTELNLGLWRESCEKHGVIKTYTIELNLQLQNREHQGLKGATGKYLRIIQKKGVPRKIWDFAVVYVAHLRSLTIFPNNQLRGRMPHCVFNGDTQKKLPYLEFEW